jgi:hypothetical protein
VNSTCSECSQTYATSVLFCPRCAARLFEIRPASGPVVTVAFSGGSRSQIVLLADGQPVQAIANLWIDEAQARLSADVRCGARSMTLYVTFGDLLKCICQGQQAVLLQ